MRFISSRVKALLSTATRSNTFCFIMVISTLFIVGCVSYGIILLNASIASFFSVKSFSGFSGFEFGLFLLLAEAFCIIAILAIVSVCSCCLKEDVESYRKNPTYRSIFTGTIATTFYVIFLVFIIPYGLMHFNCYLIEKGHFYNFAPKMPCFYNAGLLWMLVEVVGIPLIILIMWCLHVNVVEDIQALKLENAKYDIYDQNGAEKK